jgi:hypothetical protein
MFETFSTYSALSDRERVYMLFITLSLVSKLIVDSPEQSYTQDLN